MDAVTAHHVALVAPQRLIAFGTGLAPMLSATGDQSLGEINYRACKVAAIASETLDALMNMPRLKGRFWRRWMEWSATH
jgi:DNA polymerase